MSQTLSKRGREPEALADSIDVREAKRFLGEETDRFLDLLQLEQSLAEEEEDCAPSEELISGVMRSLEKEIAVTCRTSNLCSNSGDTSAASDTCGDHEGQTLDSDAGVDLSYLLDASDYELGIPPSTTLNLKDEDWLSRKETSEGLSEYPDLKYFCENWQFEDGFESYQQFALYEDAWNESQLQDYLNTDFICPGMLFDEDFSGLWRLETATTCNQVL
jgi:hypothetical protein